MSPEEIIKLVSKEEGISEMIAQRCYQSQWGFAGRAINGKDPFHIYAVNLIGFGRFYVKRFRLIHAQRAIRKQINFFGGRKGLHRGEHPVPAKQDTVDIPQ